MTTKSAASAKTAALEGELMPAVLAEKARARAKALVEQIGESYFELGQLLYEIKHGNLFRDWDFNSFEEYVELELGFKIRKAENYIGIWEKLSQRLGLPWDRVSHIGWSKVAVVLPVVETRKQAETWLKRCEKHSRRELETLVREEQGKVSPPREPAPPVDRVPHDTHDDLSGAHQTTDAPFVNPDALVTEEIEGETPEGERVALHEFKVYLFPEQYSTVTAAMQRAAQLTNSDKANYLLEMLAAEFNSTHMETADGGVAQRLQKWVKDMERIFDVQITVDVGPRSKLRSMSRLG